jgi:hypothetical protein
VSEEGGKHRERKKGMPLSSDDPHEKYDLVELLGEG